MEDLNEYICGNINTNCWRLVDETFINKQKRTHANSLLEIL